MALPLGAQNDAGGYRIGPVYAEKFPSVSVVLEVSSKQSAMVKQIHAASLQVVEDGVAGGGPAALNQFKDTARGLAVALLVDVSPSMRGGPLEAIKDAARDYLSEMT